MEIAKATAKATADIVRAEREYAAAVEERKKAERYERECWGFVLEAREAGCEVFQGTVDALDKAIHA